MFVFDSETLRHLLEQIKVQIDKKISIEQYAIKAQETDEDALIIGEDIQLSNPLIQDLINKNVTVETGDKVLIRNKVLSEANYTQEEKEVVQEILESGGLEGMLDARLDGLDLEVITKEEYAGLVERDELNTNKLYIVTDKDAVALEIDNYITKEQYEELAAQKVDKVTYINSNNEEVEKVLSTNDFTEAYAAIVDFILEKGGVSGLITSDEIIDTLDSDDVNKPLSAKQGKVLKEEYLGNMKHQYISQEDYNSIEEKEEDVIYHIEDAETLYGLTEEQMLHLKAAYEFSLRDLSQSYAKREEVYQSRKNLDGRFFSSLSERLFALDDLANTIIHDTDSLSDVIVGRYGVQFDFEEQEATRLFNAVGKESVDFDHIYPWSQMRRCNTIDGEIVAYEDDEGYIEDGSNGDVMVEIPKFWYKVVPVKLEDAASGEGQQIAIGQWIIADRPMETYKVHPAFIRNGKEVDRIYVGAFEACMYDASAGAYDVNNSVNDIDLNADFLGSISGVIPSAGRKKDGNGNYTIGKNLIGQNIRTLCENKGQNYSSIDFSVISALQLLFLIEHASFDCKSELGTGFIGATTSENFNGKITGSSGATVYRNIENLWGNIWVWIDGLNINAKQERFAYWSNDNHISDISEGYNKINFKMHQTDTGYIDRFGYDKENDFVFLPTRTTGSSVIAPHNVSYLSSTNDWAVLYHGGAQNTTVSDGGLWSLNMFNSSNSSFYNVGARIQFYK